MQTSNIWMHVTITLTPYSIMAVVVVIEWWLSLQLSVQSAPITNKVVCSNHVHDEVYSIQHYVIKLVSI